MTSPEPPPTAPDQPAAPATRTAAARAVPRGAPAAPADLAVRAVSLSEVNLTWELCGSSETAVLIERKAGREGRYRTLATLPGASNIFTDRSCWAGTTYTYRVKARNAAGDSAPSHEGTATTPAVPKGALAVVANLKAVASSPTTATVSFTDPNTGDGKRTYFLERSADGVAYRVVALLGTATSWKDVGLAPGAAYSYRVRGCSWNAETSDYSPSASVTLPRRPQGAPVEPSGLAVRAVAARSVTLTWTNNDPSRPNFKIERATFDPWHPMTWARVGVTGRGATTFTDNRVRPESTYAYRVRASNGRRDSLCAVPASGVMRSLAGDAVYVCTASAGSGSPRTYDIGPGKTYRNIADLDWRKLGPGDTVNIHYKPGGYHELFQISTRGSPSAWITVNGVPDPRTGALPVIDGLRAVMAAQFVNAYAPLAGYGCVVVGVRPGYVAGYKPGYIRIQNLQIQNCYKGNSPPTFTNHDGTTKTYGEVGAGIYLERCDHVTIKNCVITGNGEGVFGAGQSGFDRLMTDVTLDSNSIHGNGNVGRCLEHNTYLEGIDTVYQFNRYGPLRPGAEGAGLKDRSAGLVIRSNYIEGGAHQLQLPEAQNQGELAVTLLRYRRTLVYGNVLVAPPGTGASLVFFGGDQGLLPFNRKGTLYLYHNTLVACSDQSRVYKISAVELSSAGEALDARNNILTAVPATARGKAPDFGLLGAANYAYFGRNWVRPGYHLTTQGSYQFAGRAAGIKNVLVGRSSDPGFADLARGDYRLAAGSECIDAACRLPGSPTTLPVTHQFRAPRGGAPRPVVGAALDLGAFEFGPFPK